MVNAFMNKIWQYLFRYVQGVQIKQVHQIWDIWTIPLFV